MTDTDKNCPHCGTHIDEHPASPCLNAWVAEDVMGVKIIEIENHAKFKGTPVTKYWVRDDSGLLPSPYSKRIATAMEVVEKLRGNGVAFGIDPRWDKLCVVHFLVPLDADDPLRDGFIGNWQYEGIADKYSHAICRAAIKAMPKKEINVDLVPRLEEIAKAAAEISTMSSEEAFEVIVTGIIKMPEQLQMMIDTIVAMQDKWPMPAEGWKQFVEDIDHTNKKHGLDLRIDLTKCPNCNVVLKFGQVKDLRGGVYDCVWFCPKCIWPFYGEKYIAQEIDDDQDCPSLDSDIKNFDYVPEETEMPKSILYKMYAADTIRLIKATLEGTTTPMVPFKVDPLEFCHEAHKVKDELVSHAMELLENDIPITKQGDGWISVKEQMPEMGQKILVWDDLWALGPSDEFVGWAFVYMGEDLTEPLVLGSSTVLVSHWMPLPLPPKQIAIDGACAGCGLPLDGDHAPWCRTLKIQESE